MTAFSENYIVHLPHQTHNRQLDFKALHKVLQSFRASPPDVDEIAASVNGAVGVQDRAAPPGVSPGCSIQLRLPIITTSIQINLPFKKCF